MKKLFIIIILLISIPLLSSNANHAMTNADELVYVDKIYKKCLPLLHDLTNEDINYIFNIHKKEFFPDQTLDPIALARSVLRRHRAYLLKNIHKEYISNPSSYKTYSTQSIELIIDHLKEQIKKKETAMLPENINAEKRGFLYLSCIPILIFSGVALSVAYAVYENHKEFFSGHFSHINISSALFKKLSSTRFTLAEKRYLDKFKVEHITVNDTYNERWYPSYATEYELSTNHLSSRGKEKLTYLALSNATQQHITDIKKDIKSKMLTPERLYGCFWGCWMTGLLYLVGYYAPIERAKLLKQEKQFLNALTQELEDRFSFNEKPV